MNKVTDNTKRIEELQQQLLYANSLGVRAKACGDAEQSAEAKRLHDEATQELKLLRVSA